MYFPRIPFLPLLIACALALSACTEDPRVAEQPRTTESATSGSAGVAEVSAEVSAEAAPEIAQEAGDDAGRLLVHKSETCGCCALWVDHLTEEGVAADVQTEVDMEAVKARLGVPERHRSCHTAVSKDGYVFEGHVPALAIRRFMQNPPEGALGLAVPGMPVGSPGMEVDNQFQPYQIILMMKDGSAKPYGYISTYESQFDAQSPASVERP